MKKRKLLDLAINADTYAWEPFPHDQWARDMLYRKLWRPNLQRSPLFDEIWKSLDLNISVDHRLEAMQILYKALHEEM